MQTVTLKAFAHRQQECIGIFYLRHAALTAALKKIPGIKWSKTHTCWYLPLNKEAVTVIEQVTDKLAVLETSQLKTYLQKRKTVTATLATAPQKATPPKIPLPAAPVYQLGTQNLQALELFVQQLN